MASDAQRPSLGVQHVVPILRIFDEEKAREFYVGFLGFAIDWEHRFEPETPVYMQVSRDGIRLHLSEHHGDGTPGTYIRVDVTDIEAVHKELSTQAYKYNRPGIQRMPWGTREVAVTDPFNNKIIFNQHDQVTA